MVGRITKHIDYSLGRKPFSIGLMTQAAGKKDLRCQHIHVGHQNRVIWGSDQDSEIRRCWEFTSDDDMAKVFGVTALQVRARRERLGLYR